MVERANVQQEISMQNAAEMGGVLGGVDQMLPTLEKLAPVAAGVAVFDTLRRKCLSILEQ